MKRFLLSIIILFTVIAGSYVLLAQEKPPRSEKQPIHRTCPRCNLIARDMTFRQIIPIEDGSIVIMIGNTLLKYDYELNLVKKQTIAVDMDKVYQRIRDMSNKCPNYRRTGTGTGEVDYTDDYDEEDEGVVDVEQEEFELQKQDDDGSYLLNQEGDVFEEDTSPNANVSNDSDR